jgi:hypothetical protein
MYTLQYLVYSYVVGNITYQQYISLTLVYISLGCFMLVFLHELGHILYLFFIKQTNKLRVGINKKGIFVSTDSDLNVLQKIFLRLSGVFFGLLYFVFVPDLFLFFIYMGGCSSDLKEIILLLQGGI